MCHVRAILNFVGALSLQKNFVGHVPPVHPLVPPPMTIRHRAHMLEHIYTSCTKKGEKGYCKVYQNYTGTVLATLHISGQEILSSDIHNPYFSNI